MQPLKSIKNFFRNRYVKTVEFFTARLMTFAIGMMNYLMALKGRNLGNVEQLATRFAVLTAGLMRELIVLKGKDPDYVAPPSAVKEETKEQPRYVAGAFVGAYPSYMPAWVAASFQNIWKHPVMKSRLEFEAKEAARKAPRVTAAVVVPDPVLIETLMPTIEEETKTTLPTEEVVH